MGHNRVGTPRNPTLAYSAVKRGPMLRRPHIRRRDAVVVQHDASPPLNQQRQEAEKAVVQGIISNHQIRAG
jgi:hypothetical protein